MSLDPLDGGEFRCFFTYLRRFDRQAKDFVDTLKINDEFMKELGGVTPPTSPLATPLDSCKTIIKNLQYRRGLTTEEHIIT